MSAGPVSNRKVVIHRPVFEERSSGSPSELSAAKAPPGERPQICRVTPRHGWYLPLKRAFDLVAAVILLVISLPLLVCGMLLVKLTSRGPALYRQVRVGLEGREFALFKLRTMKHNAEAGTGPVWSTGNDSRVTSIGKILRKTHIDEFPQLWNVIRGQMSLIGPRPERPEFVARLDWVIPLYRERLNVRPGITGLAQLRLPPDSSLESVKRKVAHDVYYVQHVNPSLDGKLLVLTAWQLLTDIYDCCWKAVKLPRSEEVEQVVRRTVGSGKEASPVTLTSLSAQEETQVEMPEHRA